MKIRIAIITLVLKCRYLYLLFRLIIKIAKKMEENFRVNKTNQKIMEFQKKLVPLIRKMNENVEISFSSVLHDSTEGGYNWRPAKEIKGEFLEKSFPADPERAIEISKKIADDYQKVIYRYLQTNDAELEGEREKARDWLFGNLLKWSGPIVEEGIIEHNDVEKIVKGFEKALEREGDAFFGYCHGNIIGDHVFLDENKNPYLFGLKIVVRPGDGYYDFLRTVDWFLLKSDNEKIDFDKITGWMKKHLSEENWEDVKLVFALRCIGILGWDMLHRGDFGTGRSDVKINLLKKFILRDY